MLQEGKTIRLMIAEDHELVREGVKQILAASPDIKIVAEAANGAETLNQLNQTHCDLLLLDVFMPGVSGIDLVKQIKQLRHPPAVLAISMQNDPRLASRMLSAGAGGYITKSNNVQGLLAAIRKVASGSKYIEPAIAERIVLDGEYSERLPHETLSERERQTLLMFVSGMQLKEIAYQLTLSEKTISTHKTRVMKKLGVSNNSDLVRYALKHHLAEI